MQFDNTVAIVSDYYIGNKVGNLKVAQPERKLTTTSEVKMAGGRPTYFVNGVATAPIWFARPERDPVSMHRGLPNTPTSGSIR